MKKTISLILAASSFAMGATEIPVQWEYGSGSFQDGTPSNAITPISVLLQIALKEMDALGGYGPVSLFNWSSDDFLYSGGVAVDPAVGELYVADGYSNKKAEWDLPVWRYGPATGYEQSLLGYTFTPGGDITISLINVKTDGSFEEMQQWSTSTSIPADAQITLGSFYYEMDSVTPHSLYNGVLTNAEMESSLKAIVRPDSPAVPEPTTATLSLMALCGLAARRRRS